MSEQEQQPYVVVERRASGVVAFLCGALVGAGVALLLAPKSGRETQADLKEGARRLREGTGERLTDLRDTLGERYDRTRDRVETQVGAFRRNVADRQKKAGEAIKAGKDAARQARSDLEARVSESKEAYRAALADGEAPEDHPEDGSGDGSGDGTGDEAGEAPEADESAGDADGGASRE
ncbi:YtxH domain-containing protein [Candidatus Palauibacter polyketidifaciens]|uniref:YtxH domain-containing protein n=1 Tax=Candidatus Palauibacter polyketidifaciens TaxID=3056740 RepID=UPI00239D1527|nr:YtxH domain-containing protein [Candidatus Palauibacter polyketidifaciens]MDE2719408.1 YtxH domain-containing protein [Candidatus Palauibacter polyketidifaciens]